MGKYDEWSKIEEDEADELQDSSFYEGKRDVILFCIDASSSMLELHPDLRYEGDVQTSNLLAGLEAAVQIMKRKVIVGPNDAVGIMVFNTTRKSEGKGQGSEIKRGTFLYQSIQTVNAESVQEVLRLLESAREDPNVLRETFPPMEDSRVPMGDVFTSCNWVIRDGAPKTATKRVFLITDEDEPNPDTNVRFVTTARTTLIDLIQAGVQVEPFFISTDDKPFDVTTFYSSVLMPTNLVDVDDADAPEGVLPESISLTRLDDLLQQMRVHEVPKRALFSIPLQLAPGIVIGVKGYGLVTEQRKGAYRYFADVDGEMRVASSRTVYVDEERQTEADKSRILYGMSLGAAAADEETEEADQGGAGARVVPAHNRPFFTADEVRSFRTLGLNPGMKLLGFKDRIELAFEDNIKHSLFVYPDETAYSGSRRTFTALLRTMLAKKKIALVLALTRRNASPTFCALVPQAEKQDESGWPDPAGFHLIPLPFADDIRAAPVEQSVRASDELKDKARAWVDKLSVKSGAYPPDSYPNPALAFHNAQLEAAAFREDFDVEGFEDQTVPKYDMIHKRAGALMKEWKKVLMRDESADTIIVKAGSKRKADIGVDEAEIRSKHDDGKLDKLRVDQLKEFLKSKGESVGGRKAELVERVALWLDTHANT